MKWDGLFRLERDPIGLAEQSINLTNSIVQGGFFTLASLKV